MLHTLIIFKGWVSIRMEKVVYDGGKKVYAYILMDGDKMEEDGEAINSHLAGDSKHIFAC